jgi:hypothetical protein
MAKGQSKENWRKWATRLALEAAERSKGPTTEAAAFFHKKYAQNGEGRSEVKVRMARVKRQKKNERTAEKQHIILGLSAGCLPWGTGEGIIISEWLAWLLVWKCGGRGCFLCICWLKRMGRRSILPGEKEEEEWDKKIKLIWSVSMFGGAFWCFFFEKNWYINFILSAEEEKAPPWRHCFYFTAEGIRVLAPLEPPANGKKQPAVEASRRKRPWGN